MIDSRRHQFNPFCFLIFNSFTFNSFTKWFLLAQCGYNSPLYFIVFKTIQQHHFHIRTPLMIFFNTTEPRPVLIPSSDVRLRLIHSRNFQLEYVQIHHECTAGKPLKTYFLFNINTIHLNKCMCGSTYFNVIIMTSFAANSICILVHLYFMTICI